MGYSVTIHSFLITARHTICLAVIASLLFLPVPTAHAFFDFSIKDEAELGRKFNVLVRSRMPLVQDPEIVDYITDMVSRLSTAMPPQPFPFTVSVLRHNSVNAFAVPGGYIFVCTGLINAMTHEAELAGVLAHEMAHVTQRHIALRIQKSAFISLLSILGALAGVFLGGDAGSAMVMGSAAAGQAAMLNYSRTDENEADMVGLGYLSKAGYKPNGMAGAFKVLGRKQWLISDKIPTYYSTHPDINDRMKDMEAQAAHLPKEMQNRPHNDDVFFRIQTLTRARYSDPDVAAITFTKELQKKQNPLSYLGQGILFSRKNQINNAKAAFDKALALAPQDGLIAREAGWFHYSKGDKNTGIALLQQALTLNRNDLFALFYSAKIMADQGHYAKAIDMLYRVHLAVPEDIEVHENLASAYGQNKQMFQAYLHLAYSALYANNKTKTKQLAEKLAALAKTSQEKAMLQRFNSSYKTRKEIW